MPVLAEGTLPKNILPKPCLFEQILRKNMGIALAKIMMKTSAVVFDPGDIL